MIDVIVPVYNTPIKDLERCFNSILNQTFNEYLVYIIDDGSNIKIKNYLDNYVKDKSKFIVKHIKNGGVSSARNLGLNISNNEYITFVDSDDTLNKEFLKEAYDLIKENNLDLIIGGYNEIIDNEIVRVRVSLPGIHIYEGNTLINFFEKLLSGKTNEGNKEIGDCPTGRIYTRLFKKKSLENLKFNSNIHMSEDTLFMIDYMKQAKRIGIIDRVWYNYYVNKYSISNGTKRDKLISNIEGFVNEITERCVKESNMRIKNAYKARIQKANYYITKLKKTNQMMSPN